MRRSLRSLGSLIIGFFSFFFYLLRAVARITGRDGTRRLGLGGHDVEDHGVGGAHGVGADDGEVVDRAVDVVIDDALGAGDVTAFHGEHCRQQGGGDA